MQLEIEILNEGDTILYYLVIERVICRYSYLTGREYRRA